MSKTITLFQRLRWDLFGHNEIEEVDRAAIHSMAAVLQKSARLAAEESVTASGWSSPYPTFSNEWLMSLASTIEAIYAQKYEALRPPTDPGTTHEHIPATIRAQVADAFPACVACGSTHDLHVDHIWPRSRGGDNDIRNLWTLCKSCNSGKSDRHPFNWLPSLGLDSAEQYQWMNERIKAAVELARERGCDIATGVRI